MTATTRPLAPSIRLALALGLMALISVASLVPGDVQGTDSVFIWAVAETPTPLQKLLHVVLYGMLAFLWMWALAAVEPVALRLIIALLLTGTFGASMEWAQTFVPGRFGSLRDIFLNTIGSIVGTIAAARLLSKHRI